MSFVKVFAALVEIAAGGLAIGGAVVGWDRLDTAPGKFFTVAAVGLLILTLSLLFALGLGGQLTISQLTWAQQLTALVCSACLVCATASISLILSRSTGTSSESRLEPNTAFEITLPDQGIPACVAVPGRGIIPEDKDLWIYEIDPGRSQWPKARAEVDPSDPNAWSTPVVGIGTDKDSTGTKHHLYAYLLDKQTSVYVQEVMGEKPSTEAPPSYVWAADKEVKRIEDRVPTC